MQNESFIDKTLEAFKKINSEINIDSLEHDFSPRFVEHFVKQVLDYEGNNYHFERGRTDITLQDENGNRTVVIETKRPNEDLNAEKWQNQAGKYADETTKYIGLTNGFRFLLWEIDKKEKKLKVDINFKELISNKKTSEDKLSTQELEQLLFLGVLQKQQIWSEDKYLKFNEYYAKIDVAEIDGFDKLITQLKYISSNLLTQYTYNAFDEYYAGFMQYKQSLGEIDSLKKQASKNPKLNADIARFQIKTEGKFKKYSSFSGYNIWKELSNRTNSNEDENKQVFCKESIYVLINRLLFIRICEDKELLKKKISNGGMERLREELSEPIVGDSEVFKQIIKFSYSGARKIYYHFYEKDNPLDWYESGDGDLDKVLNKVLWLLNQFNFAKIDRDILGKIYEKYLPKDERKKLGEFYTPDEIIDYILDATEYTPNKSIENKTLIDPACGSGGFLVRATRRLIARHVVKLEKATPKEALDPKNWVEICDKLTSKECEEIVLSVAQNIHGFDINPFAVNISEMNILFQIIDLYHKAVKENPSFVIPRLNIYETDSLEPQTTQANLAQFQSSTGESLAKDKTQIEELKNKKYDFVVGNPPWIGILKLPKHAKDTYSHFVSAKGKYDLYILFIELGTKILAKNGKLGYITQNRFLKVDYAESLRKYLQENIAIRQIADFGDRKLFADATNYPCILIIEKEFPNRFEYLEFKPASEKINDSELLQIAKKYWGQNKYEDKNIRITIVTQKCLNPASWIIESAGKNTVLKKLSTLPLLSKYTEKIMQGITCGGDGSDKIFYVPQNKIDSFKLEERILKKSLRGKNIRKYSSEPAHEFLLYPYQENGQPIDLRLFPGTTKYLNQFKEKLTNRKLDGKLISQWNKEWFELWRERESKFFAETKIVCPRIAESNRFALDDTNAFLSDSAVVIVPKQINQYLLLGLLNSTLLQEYIKIISPFVQGKYYNYSKTYLERLPIKLPTNKKEEIISENIVLKVKEILKLKKKQPETNTLHIEQEIDSLVYDLYGLTTEDKKIIENSLKHE
jgi:type I restriction-modification system DNA methylase subunit